MAGDVVRESAQAGRVVLWEESPRDGAQAKTLMTADFRVRLARARGEVFTGAGPRHVVFAAGFPAVCREEFEAVRKVAVEAEGSVSVSAVCRGTPGDVRQALAAVRGSTHARIMVIVPASEAMARVMTHTSAEQALTAGAVLVAQARETDDSVAVDVCLADASRADHALVAEHAARMKAAGAGVVVLADTVGDQLPEEAAAMFTRVRRFAGEEAVLASQGGTGGGVGVDRVRLAGAAAFGPVGAVDLDDPVPVGAGGSGEAGSVGRGAFHTDRDHMAVCGQESQGRRVPGGGGGEFGVREMAAVVADDSDMDRVGVGIDSAEHMLARSLFRDP
ncbi:2-isopropylmalate synthase [Streptomyces sp. ADI92-24]|uniref:hypothetical protein n=1 Tax=Streptomyces sp. ADI92-24 TaxID=1522756 RepID=UPI000FB058FB|nr:hypothetical protein [Streptomyces sp. ADI92-24]RPK38206.1 2-isopropylmalate synthase [Streptomyces sp. ADI92-24]